MTQQPFVGSSSSPVTITGYELSSLYDNVKVVNSNTDCTAPVFGIVTPGPALTSLASDSTRVLWAPTYLISGNFLMCYMPYNRTAYSQVGSYFFVNDTRLHPPVGLRKSVPEAPETTASEWMDFTPRTVNMGESVTYTFTGFKTFGYGTIGVDGQWQSNIWAKIVVANCLELYTSVPGALPQRLGAQNEASFVVDKTGNYKMCVQYRLDWEETNDWITVISTENPSSLYYGYTTCEHLLMKHANMCGCFYQAADPTLVSTITLPIEYPGDYIGQTDLFGVVNQGCCDLNAPRYPNATTGPNWGWCIKP
jgi:hypothetical protein